MRLFPAFLALAERPVLVVGGGAVAARKARELQERGAIVRVVARAVGPEMAALAAETGLTPAVRAFRADDVDDVFLVVAATDDGEAQRAIAAACDARRRLCLAVDDVANTSVYGAACVERGPITLAISTGGEAPALARLLREILEQVLPDELRVEQARALRARWRQEQRPMGERFDELVRALAARRATSEPRS